MRLRLRMAIVLFYCFYWYSGTPTPSGRVLQAAGVRAALDKATSFAGNPDVQKAARNALAHLPK